VKGTAAPTPLRRHGLPSPGYARRAAGAACGVGVVDGAFIWTPSRDQRPCSLFTGPMRGCDPCRLGTVAQVDRPHFAARVPPGLDGRRSVDLPGDGDHGHGMGLSAELRPSLIRLICRCADVADSASCTVQIGRSPPPFFEGPLPGGKPSNSGCGHGVRSFAGDLDRQTSSNSAAQPVQKPRFISLSVNAPTREAAIRAVVGIGLIARVLGGC
jgi:hypothetical protein